MYSLFQQNIISLAGVTAIAIMQWATFEGKRWMLPHNYFTTNKEKGSFTKYFLSSVSLVIII